MPLFRYKAIDASGKTVSGVYNADLIKDVELWLSTNAQCPISIEAVSPDDSPAPAKKHAARISLKERFFGVQLHELILFCRQIATLLAAGIPLHRSLEIMIEQASNLLWRQSLIAINSAIEGGVSLSEAVGQHPKMFSRLFYNIIRIGEETGSLEKSFLYLASLYENEKEIKERISNATRYPKIVITALLGAIIFLMIFVIPKFINLFSNSKVALPLPTRILVTISDFFSTYSFFLLAVALLLFILYRIASNYEEFRLFKDRIQLQIPVFGPLTTKIYMSRFCKVFSVLTESGVDIIKTLKLSATALDNLVLVRIVETISDDVEQGLNLYDAMSKHTLFPTLVSQMITVGEESGNIDTMMARVSEYYEVESDYTIKNLSSIIEPALLLFMGVLVCFIALAIFTPMWDMMRVVRG